MIHNLKAKLQNLPKTEIRAEAPPKTDFECSHYVREFEIAGDGLISFVKSDISHLKTACKIEDSSDIHPDEIVFFDTETTGLAGGTGTVAFLVGVGRLEDGVFKVRQFLMNDYHQEPSVLTEFAKSLKGAKAVATYNGKSFDAPLITARSIMNRITLELDKYPHFDLLHACRRLYKMRLERMKLTDIEEHILGIVREDDIPGAEIPEIFFRYLKYGESSLLEKVIEHNVQDIVSLAKISGILADVYRAPHETQCSEDAYCAARTLIQMQRYEAAQSVLEAVKDDVSEARAELAYLMKYLGRYEYALELFSSLSEGTRFDMTYDIEAAKILEHRMKNYEQALNFTYYAKEKLLNNRLLGRNFIIMDDVDKRIERLKYKSERK